MNVCWLKSCFCTPSNFVCVVCCWKNQIIEKSHFLMILGKNSNRLWFHFDLTLPSMNSSSSMAPDDFLIDFVCYPSRCYSIILRKKFHCDEDLSVCAFLRLVCTKAGNISPVTKNEASQSHSTAERNEEVSEGNSTSFFCCWSWELVVDETVT